MTPSARLAARLSIAALALGLAATPAFSQDEAQTKPAQTKPVDVKIDQSSPKETAKSFVRAVMAANSDAIATLIHQPSPELKEMFKVMAPVMAAAADLNSAMLEKFKQGLTSNNMTAMPTEQQVDEAEIAVEGETATVKLAGQPEPLKMVQKDGKWFINMDDAATIAPEQLEQAKKVMPAMTSAVKQVTDEVKADRFKSAAEVEQALQSRMMQAMMQAMQSQQQ